MARLVLPLLMVLSAGLAVADSINVVDYLGCVVVTEVDAFTDEVKHHMIYCGPEDESAGISAACLVGHGVEVPVVLFLIDSVYLPTDEVVTLKYRFDKREPFIGKGTAGSSKTVRLVPIESEYREILSGLESAESVVFQLDDKTERIDLSTMDGAEAVADYTRRCSGE